MLLSLRLQEERLGNPKLVPVDSYLALFSESAQGRVKLRKEVAGSRAEMRKNRMSPEVWRLLFSTPKSDDSKRALGNKSPLRTLTK